MQQMLNKINATTETMAVYYKKLIELEAGLIAFNMSMVSGKINEMEVIKIRLKNECTEMESEFFSQSNLRLNKENFTDFFKNNPKLLSAYNILYGYTDACKKQLTDIMVLRDEAAAVSVKFLGEPQNRDLFAQDAKKGKWSRKAKRQTKTA